MDEGKVQGLIQWINALDLGVDPINTLEELHDGKVLLKLQYAVQNSDQEDAQLPQDRFTIIQEYLEVMYQINFPRIIDVNLIIHRHDEKEIAKVALLLLCVAVVFRSHNIDNFIVPVFNLEQGVQEEVKELIESVISKHEPSRPLHVDFSVLHAQRTRENSVQASLVESFTNHSCEVFSNSPQPTGRGSTGSLKEFMSPLLAGSAANSPIPFQSLSLSSPHVVKRLMAKEKETKRRAECLVRQKDVEMRRLTLDLHSEKNLREDLQMDIEEKFKVIQTRDERIKELENQNLIVRQLKQEIEFLNDEKTQFEAELQRLRKTLLDHQSLKERNLALEEENAQLVKESQQQTDELRQMSEAREECMFLRDQAIQYQNKMAQLEETLKVQQSDLGSLAEAKACIELQLSELQNIYRTQKESFEESLHAEKSNVTGESLGFITQKRVGELEAELDISKVENKRLTLMLKDKDEEISNKLKQIQRQTEIHGEMLENEKEAVVRFRLAEEKHKAAVEELEVEKAATETKLTENYNILISNLKQEQERLKDSQKDTLDTISKEYSDKLEALSHTYSLLQSQLSLKQSEFDSLTSQFVQEKNEKSLLEGKLQTELDKFQSCQREQNALQDTIQSLDSKFLDSDKKHQEEVLHLANNMSEERASFENQIKEITFTKDQAFLDLNTLTESQMLELKQALESKDKKIEEMNKTYSDLKEYISCQQREADTIKASLETGKSELLRKVSDLTGDKESLQGQLCDLQAQVETHNKDIENLNEENSSLSKQLEKTVVERDSVSLKHEKAAKLAEELADISEKQVLQYEEELAFLKGKHTSEIQDKAEEHALLIQEMSQQHAELQITQTSEQKATVKQLEEQIFTLQQELEEKINSVLLHKDMELSTLSDKKDSEIVELNDKLMKEYQSTEDKVRVVSEEFNTEILGYQQQLTDLKKEKEETTKSRQQDHEKELSQMKLKLENEKCKYEKMLAESTEMQSCESSSLKSSFEAKMSESYQKYRMEIEETKQAHMAEVEQLKMKQQNILEEQKTSSDSRLTDVLKEAEREKQCLIESYNREICEVRESHEVSLGVVKSGYEETIGQLRMEEGSLREQINQLVKSHTDQQTQQEIDYEAKLSSKEQEFAANKLNIEACMTSKDQEYKSYLDSKEQEYMEKLVSKEQEFERLLHTNKQEYQNSLSAKETEYLSTIASKVQELKAEHQVTMETLKQELSSKEQEFAAKELIIEACRTSKDQEYKSYLDSKEQEYMDKLVSKEQEFERLLYTNKQEYQNSLSAKETEYLSTIASKVQELKAEHQVTMETLKQELSSKEREVATNKLKIEACMTSKDQEYKSYLDSKEQEYMDKLVSKEQEFERLLHTNKQEYQNSLSAKETEYLSTIASKVQELKSEHQVAVETLNQEMDSKDKEYHIRLSSANEEWELKILSKKEEYETGLLSAEVEFKAQISAKEEELCKLQNVQNVSDKELSDLKKEYDILNEELKSYKLRELEHDTSHNNCVKQMDIDFKGKEENLLEEIHEKCQAIEQLTSSRDRLQTQLCEQTKVIETLKTQTLDEQSQQNQSLSKLHEKLKEIEIEHQAVENDYETQLGKLKVEMEAVYNNNTELQDIHDSITEELQEKNQEVQATKKLVDEKEISILELQNKITKQKNIYTKKMDEMQAVMDRKVNDFLVKYEERMEQTSKERDAYVSEFKSKLHLMEEEHQDELKQMSEEFEDRLTNSTVEFETQQSLYQSKLKSVIGERDEISGKLAEANRVYDERIGMLTNEMEKLTIYQETLKRDILQQIAQRTACEEKAGRCDELERTVDQLEECREIEKKEASERCALIQSQLEASKLELKHHTEKLNQQYETQVSLSEAKIGKLQKMVDKLKGHIESREARLQGSVHELEMERQHVEKYREKFEMLDSQFNPLQKKLQDEESNNKKLSQQVRSLEVQLSHAERQVKQYRSELDKAGTALLGDIHPNFHAQTKPSSSSDDSILDDSLEAHDKRHSSPHPNRPKPAAPYFLRSRHSSTGDMSQTSGDSPYLSLNVDKTGPFQAITLTSCAMTPQGKIGSTVKQLESGRPISIKSKQKDMHQSVRSLVSLNSSRMSTVSTDSTRSANIPRGAGSLFSCEDEEDTGVDYQWNRLDELKRRNTLCLPHLKTAYPVETQAGDPKGLYNENLIRGKLTDATPSQLNTRKRRPEAMLDDKSEFSVPSTRKSVSEARHNTMDASKLVHTRQRHLSAEKLTPKKSPRRSMRRRSKSAGTPDPSRNLGDIENNPNFSVDPRRESIAFSIDNTPKALQRGLKRQTGFVRKNEAPSKSSQIERKPLGNRNVLQTGL